MAITDLTDIIEEWKAYKATGKTPEQVAELVKAKGEGGMVEIGVVENANMNMVDIVVFIQRRTNAKIHY